MHYRYIHSERRQELLSLTDFEIVRYFRPDQEHWQLTMASPLDSLPMPEPTNPIRAFSHFKAISLDVYGTMIDYKPAIYSALKPILNRLPPSSPWRSQAESEGSDMTSNIGARLLALFKTKEDVLTVGKPMRPFSSVLRDIYLAIAEEIGVEKTQDLDSEADAFGSSIAKLPAYSDTVASLKRIRALGYDLVFLSNIEREASAITQKETLGGVDFKYACNASEFVQDSPDRRKLEFLIQKMQEVGIEKDQILVVANSVGHDHVPCKELGLSSAWIVRDAVRWGKEDEIKKSLNKVGYGWRFNHLSELADAMEEEMGRK